MTIEEYTSNIKKRYQTGISREHAYRGDLQQLLETLLPDTIVTNEPARISCGSPDYVITRKDIPIGYIEAKDIGVDLDKTLKSEQIKRYTASLDNLILTDYVTFIFLKDGEVYETLELFDLYTDRQIVNGVDKTEQKHKRFELLIRDFSTHITQTIKSPTKLASMMANKAKLLAQVINNALTSDVESNANSSLKEQMEAFKQILIHDIKPAEFADIYAQTIAYGMFAARLHDPTPDTFSRQEAASLIPKSNPFLRKLFQYISGYDIDTRIEWIVSALADIFRATDVAEILKDFGKATQMNDPFIHFYEYFLAEYDPKLRKARGVWYTPEPVVNFIVRAVDDILKSEFGLPKGLADNSKTEIEVDTDIFDKKNQKYKKVKKQVHKVQILDPATGTGTFLAEVVKHIYGTKFKNMQGAWPQYVENDLIPRLNGFEILMASYAMAHLKLDLLLGETGYKATKDQRFKIYLTNSLEEANPDTGTLFANWLSTEASEANAVKRDTPVMCVIGNPPYSIKSQNKNDWILNLIKDYKRNLNEKKINLDDDYIKFIRYGQHYISRTTKGVLAFITNNSFIDGITHRQMRKDLLETFDKIYVLNLHGFAKLKEVGLVADNDENVFDIQQGVSINIFIKEEGAKEKTDAIVNYKSLYGTRKEKYFYLGAKNLIDIDWNTLSPTKPYYFFVNKDFSESNSYNLGFKITDLFLQANSGVKTDRDKLFYDLSSEVLSDRISRLLSGEFDSEFSLKYNIKDSGSYKITKVIKDSEFETSNIQRSTYRPFDSLWTYYDKKLISRPAQKAMKHIDGKQNISLIVGRQGQAIGFMDWNLVFCSSSLVDYNVFYRGGGYVFPLYVYDENNEISFSDLGSQKSNLNEEIINKIVRCIQREGENELKQDKSIESIDVFDYVYAYLHSTKYRKKYHEFLKIDFPIIPYPNSWNQFQEFVRLGKSLRKYHSFDAVEFATEFISYPCSGDNAVTRKLTKTSPGFELTNEETKTGKVWINDEQYFDNVPELAWNFYIGGYQPAQKWLKDRQGRTLTYDDIEHYQKIIAAIVETDKIMKEIDEVGVV